MRRSALVTWPHLWNSAITTLHAVIGGDVVYQMLLVGEIVVAQVSSALTSRANFGLAVNTGPPTLTPIA